MQAVEMEPEIAPSLQTKDLEVKMTPDEDGGTKRGSCQGKEADGLDWTDRPVIHRDPREDLAVNNNKGTRMDQGEDPAMGEGKRMWEFHKTDSSKPWNTQQGTQDNLKG